MTLKKMRGTRGTRFAPRLLADLPPPRRAHRLRVALERLSASRVRRERRRGFVIQRGVLEPAQVRRRRRAAVHELGERVSR